MPSMCLLKHFNNGNGVPTRSPRNDPTTRPTSSQLSGLSAVIHCRRFASPQIYKVYALVVHSQCHATTSVLVQQPSVSLSSQEWSTRHPLLVTAGHSLSLSLTALKSPYKPPYFQSSTQTHMYPDSSQTLAICTLHLFTYLLATQSLSQDPPPK